MNKLNGDDDMTILAVPCNKAMVIGQKQGEAILKQIEDSKRSGEENEKMLQKAKELRRKPDKK